MPQVINLPEMGTVRYSLAQVPEYGDSQTGAVIGLMIQYAAEDADSPEVRQAVEDARKQYPGVRGEEQIWRYVRSRVRFVQDEVLASPFQRWYSDYIVETLIRPRDLLSLPVPVAKGDCDDYSMLVASMALAMGYKNVRYVTVAADERDPDQFSHVYVAVYSDGGRYPIDASHGLYPGWEVSGPGVYRKTEWPVHGAVAIPLDIERIRIPFLVLGALGLVYLATRKKKSEGD